MQRREGQDEEDQLRPVNDWPGILSIYLGKASQETPLHRGGSYNKRMFRRRIVQVAAICLAILEALDGR